MRETPSQFSGFIRSGDVKHRLWLTQPILLVTHVYFHSTLLKIWRLANSMSVHVQLCPSRNPMFSHDFPARFQLTPSPPKQDSAARRLSFWDHVDSRRVIGLRGSSLEAYHRTAANSIPWNFTVPCGVPWKRWKTCLQTFSHIQIDRLRMARHWSTWRLTATHVTLANAVQGAHLQIR